MDTDELTSMAYDCILIAQEATDVLRSELGAACSKFKTEDEYLKGILKHVRSIEKHSWDYLDEWNLLDDIDVKVFKIKLLNVREHIKKTLKTPIEDRGPRWSPQ
jgi:hypothetical protein